MECKPRGEAVASISSASCENNSIDQTVTLRKDDFGKICRCCLSRGAITNILYLKFGETLFVDIFFDILGTQVNSSDVLPKNICEACIVALINFYNFQKTYNDSLATLVSVLRENQDYNIQDMDDDVVNEDMKEEMPVINISENELDEETQNENTNNKDNAESTIFGETQKPSTAILDDLKQNDEELYMSTNESLPFPQLEDDTENEQFKMENSDINISEDELDEKFQYEINEKENINVIDNNNESTTYLSPEKHKEKFCKNCKTWIIVKGHKCPTNRKRSYVCEICDKSFLQNATLQVHYRIHKLSLLVNQISTEEGVASSITNSTKEKRMSICYCGKVFSSSKDLAQHKTEKNHLDELDTKCEICNKVVTSQGLYRHMRTAHKSEEAADVKLDCSTCGKIFKNRQCLLNHLKLHGEKNLLCAYCGKRFHDAMGFKTHCRGHTGEKPFPCNVCDQKFRSSSVLRKHMYIHTGKKPHVCKFCSKAFRQAYHLKVHLRTHTGEKPYKCQYCDKSFTLDAIRVAHIRTHTGEKPYTCDTCGQNFSQKCSLMVHRRLHTGEKPYLCDHCGKTFTAGNTYRNHLVVKHQQKINSAPAEYAAFKCKICNRFYSSKQTLKTHMLIHGEKTHLCTYCGKGFYTKAALNRHSTVHTGEKKFSCGLCGKKFARLPDYKSHQYIHSGQKPYTCKICSKHFRQNAHLITHMRIHTGEKPYSCPYCDKSFAHSNTRTDHIRSHTGERPYVCDVCSKGFINLSAVTKHKQRHLKTVSIESAD